MLNFGLLTKIIVGTNSRFDRNINSKKKFVTRAHMTAYEKLRGPSSSLQPRVEALLIVGAPPDQAPGRQ